MSAYWCELAWLGGEHAEGGVVIEVEGDVIVGIEPGAPAPPRGAVRLDGLTLPGFANAHSHAFHRALRGHTQRGGGSFWTWRERMYELAAALDPDSYLRLARATFAEMALAGITAVGEFHYLHHGPGGEPYADPNEIGRALIAAAGEAGIRITLLDACYLHGGIGEPPNRVQRRFSDGDAPAWADRVNGLESNPGVRIGAAIHSVRAVAPEAAATVAEWAAERGCPLHAHVSEQPAENDACRDAFGVTPTRLLGDAGALGPRFTAVHAIHLDSDDVGLLGSGRCCCCLCPTTERDLADGVGPARELLEAGASLALGSDSHAVIDLLEEARAVELDERLASCERGHHGAAALLRAASVTGHACLGWRDAGRLEAGAPADLVSIRLDGVRTAGVTPETALEFVVFAAGASDVDRVICGGREIVRDGVHLGVEVARELRESIAAVRG
ncbi:MAG: formimidoylglutamate deiminase [Solirubrobacterales bacterium]|nr:formimidoylglutamate deiminase [Solirubrobacterales bacterium]